MSQIQGRRVHAERGATAVEVAVGTGLAAVLSLAMIGVVRTTDRGHQAMRETARAEEGLRGAAKAVGEALAAATAGRIQVTADANGQSVVDSQSVVSYGGGDPLWGVERRELGGDDAHRVRVGWRRRLLLLPGTSNRRLVEPRLDDAGEVQMQREILREAIGFLVMPPTGAAISWRVKLVLLKRDGSREVLNFEVVPRN